MNSFEQAKQALVNNNQQRKEVLEQSVKTQGNVLQFKFKTSQEDGASLEDVLEFVAAFYRQSEVEGTDKVARHLSNAVMEVKNIAKVEASKPKQEETQNAE